MLLQALLLDFVKFLNENVYLIPNFKISLMTVEISLSHVSVEKFVKYFHHELSSDSHCSQFMNHFDIIQMKPKLFFISYRKSKTEERPIN